MSTPSSCSFPVPAQIASLQMAIMDFSLHLFVLTHNFAAHVAYTEHNWLNFLKGWSTGVGYLLQLRAGQSSCPQRIGQGDSGRGVELFCRFITFHYPIGKILTSLLKNIVLIKWKELNLYKKREKFVNNLKSYISFVVLIFILCFNVLLLL